MEHAKLFLIILGLSLCMPVFAEDSKQHKSRPHGPKIFAKMDTNSDEKISLQEFKTPREGMFKRMDQNGDELVTLDEMKKARIEMREKRQEKMNKRRQKGDENMETRFKEMDLDDNGGLTAKEAKTGMFNHLDANKDGFLTKEELRPPRRRPYSRSGQIDDLPEH